MHKYTIEWSEVKREGETNGRPWKITEMTLKDEQGVTIDKVSTLDAVVTGGTIEGEVTKNDKGYLNFKASSNKKPNMDRLMEKKSTQIAESQQRKENSIMAAQDRSAWMWAKTNASSLIASPAYIEKNLSVPELEDRVLKLATLIYNGEPTEPFTG